MSASIEAGGLGKRYGSIWALRGCNLEVPAGRVVALIGPNGAGKSTLLSLVMGLTDPTCGKVAVAGGLRSGSEPALAEVAFLAQDHALYRRFTVQDHLHLAKNLNARFDDSFAKARLCELGISLDRPAGKLSGGQQAQVALTLALAKRSSILLLDEPVASLDPLARRDFMSALMTAVADSDTTVVLSSHVVAELERVCDFLVVLSRAEVQLVGAVDALLRVHRRLIGPASGTDAPNGVDAVIERVSSNRQVTLVARVGRPIHDPAWESRPVSLEDLALAYLGAPESAYMSRAELTLTPGGMQ